MFIRQKIRVDKLLSSILNRPKQTVDKRSLAQPELPCHHDPVAIKDVPVFVQLSSLGFRSRGGSVPRPWVNIGLSVVRIIQHLAICVSPQIDPIVDLSPRRVSLSVTTLSIMLHINSNLYPIKGSSILDYRV